MTVGFNPYMPQTEVLNTKDNTMKVSKDSAVVSKKGSKDNSEADYGAVYERSDAAKEGSVTSKEGLYSINKKNATDRAAIAGKMKADADQRQRQMEDLVEKILNGQGKAYAAANGNESLWQKLSQGNLNVDSATRKKALDDISENGYYGVKQTSQRLFDFASALAGDDVEKMRKMEKAMEKGFSQARKAFGGGLPSICQETMSRAHSLFEDYYRSKGAPHSCSLRLVPE